MWYSDVVIVDKNTLQDSLLADLLQMRQMKMLTHPSFNLNVKKIRFEQLELYI